MSRTTRSCAKAAATCAIAFFLCLAVLGSCKDSGGSSSDDDGSAESPNTVKLDIAGKWHMATRDQDITLTDGAIVFNAGANSGLTGTILSCDNGARYLVMKWTKHPAFTGKYQRWNWAGSPVSSLALGAELDTSEAAAADTSAKYAETITSILFSDDFDRADTTSPSVGSSIWTVDDAPNTVSISGNMLRFGTANAKQVSMHATTSLDLSSDFRVSVKFKNMRFDLWLGGVGASTFGFMPMETGTYIVLCPDESTPVINEAIAAGLSADTWYRLEVSKVGTAITSKIYNGTTAIYSKTYAYTGTESFSSVGIGLGGGGNVGWGTGDVFVDNLRVEKL
jgi:hypothetical protein